MLLSDYLTEVRTHLEEFPFSGVITSSPSIFWSDVQLTSAINKARQRVSIETFCCRTFVTIPAVEAQLVYKFSTLLAQMGQMNPPPPASSIVHLHNVTFNWATSFAPMMRRYGWSEFAALFLAYPTLQSQSAAWAMYDSQTFYIWPPAPGNSYSMNCDITYLPAPLVNASDPDTAIPEMFGWTLVPLLACKWALYYRRAYEESKEFLGLYMEERDTIVQNLPAWSVQNWYGD